MQIKQTVLPNGIKIITDSMKEVRSATLGIWFTCGSRQENPEHGGVAHLIEHMMFKGTNRRSARQLAQEMDYLGGHMNAYTSAEYTFYYMKSLDIYLEKVFDLLSDMLLNPLLAEKDIKKEKRIILQEYDMYADNPEDLAQGKYFSWVWPKHPLGMSIIGSKKTIRGLNRTAIEKYRSDFYRPDNLIVAVAGNIEHEQVVGLTQKYLKGFTGTSVKKKNTAAVFHSGKKYVAKDTEQTQVIWGVPGISYADEDRYQAAILNNIIGASGSSRLFQSIREDAGLAYSIYSGFDSYSDSGVFSISAGIKPENTTKLLSSLKKEINDILDKGITEAELSRAKEQIISMLLVGLETSDGRMQRLGKLLVMDRPVQSVEEIIERVSAITVEEVNAMARRLFKGVQPAILQLGPKLAKK